MSNNDFDGSYFGPDGGRGADEQGAGPHGTGLPGDGTRYPAPEGWDQQGFWRDSSIDSDYDTGLHNPVPPHAGSSREEPGYSYFSDGAGWQSSPAPAAPQPGPAAPQPALPASAWPGAGGPQGSGGYGGYDGGYGAPGPGVPGGYGAGGTGGFNVPGGPGGAGGPLGPGGPGGPIRPGGPRGPAGRGGKRKGSWWRRWTWKKALAVTGGLALVFVLCLFGVYEYLSSTATIPDALASANYQNTTVYYSDGTTVLGTIGTVNRQDLTFNQIPKTLQDSVISAEDRSFWTEGAISPTGILRSAYDDVVDGDTSGGSTITQQFVRNYYEGIGTQQTASRKIKEIFVAQKLAQTKSKQWILTNYMNLIYLGDNSYGVAAAGETYFGKPVAQLTLAQDAVIAAVIQQPSTYPLPQYRSDLVARWHYVLNGLVKMGDLTQAQATAMTFPKLLTDSSSSSSSSQTSLTASNKDPWAPYLMDVVYNELTATKSAGGDGVPVQQLETGGLKIVTTISKSSEEEMYKSVDANIAAIKATPGAEFPSYIRIGAELQNPADGEILAMYPGPGQDMSTAQCKQLNCDLNTAVYAREQVGSSFKPYVLSAAVADGMNVKTSTLNASPYLCVPQDSEPMVLSSTKVSFTGDKVSCPNDPGYYGVENDGGEVIGNPKKGGGTTVQNALAQSSNTAFTDLTHRVTTGNVIQMAQNFGVNIATFPTGSGLTVLLHQVGLALGTASLTVNEQTTMLSAIDDNGVYHQAHIVKYWQTVGGAEQQPSVATHNIFSPDPTTNAQLDSQVQYAMEMTTVDGTGTAAGYGLGNRPIIAKTGTTSGSTSGFFIGAIPQYSLVVGMFTANPADSSESLVPLSGGGFGGYWPAKIWNTFAQDEFANLSSESFQNPVFTGQAWNQVGKIAPPTPTVTCIVHGKKAKINGKACPTPAPTPTPSATCSYPGEQYQDGCTVATATATPTPTCSYPGEQYQDGCSTATAATPAPTCSYPGQTGCSSTSAGATPTPSSTCSTFNPACIGTGTGPGTGGLASNVATAGSTKAGLALGGGLGLLPGSLVLRLVSRRRRRREAGAPR